jgi:hypothetical protein
MVARLRDGPYYLVDAIVRGDGTSQRGDAGTVTTLGVRARARFGTHEPEHAPHVLIESTVDGGVTWTLVLDLGEVRNQEVSASVARAEDQQWGDVRARWELQAPARTLYWWLRVVRE